MALRSGRLRAHALTLALGVSLLAPFHAGADDPGAGTVDLGEGQPVADEPAPPPTRGERAFSVWEKAFDAVVLRPLGAGATVGGFAFFLISVPFTAPSKNIPVCWDIFVLGPYDYKFVRPLGEF